MSRRKAIAFGAAAMVMVLPIVSLVTARRLAGGALAPLGYGMFAVGAGISLLNFHLSFVHPALRGATPPRFVSGLPLLGMVTLAGLTLVPPSAWLAGATFALLLIDTGNLPWFVVSSWRDESMW